MGFSVPHSVPVAIMAQKQPLWLLTDPGVCDTINVQNEKGWGPGTRWCPCPGYERALWEGINMNSLRDVRITIEVRSRLLDARLLASSAELSLLAITAASESGNGQRRESALADIGMLLSIIDESVEGINAAEERLPKIVKSAESDRVG